MGTKQIDAFAAHAKDAEWIKDGLRPYFRYRDLGIKNATQGRVMAQVIKAAEPCKGPMGYHSHVLDFQMGYMVKGWARMYFEGFGEMRVEAGDTWYQPPRRQARAPGVLGRLGSDRDHDARRVRDHGRGPVAAQVPGVGRPSWT